MSDLPRPRRTWLWAAAAPVAAAVALIAVVLTGAASSTDDAAPGEASAEAGFARDMAVHHQQAVEMSFLVRERTGDEEVRRLAYDIINTQANQRGMLLGWLDQWGLGATSAEPVMGWMGHGRHEPRDGSLMPGMATDTQLDELKGARGKQAEVLFLQLMTRHHRGGIDMAEAAAEMAGDEPLVRLAKGMVRGQQSEIRLMAGMLEDRGARTP